MRSSCASASSDRGRRRRRRPARSGSCGARRDLVRARERERSGARPAAARRRRAARTRCRSRTARRRDRRARRCTRPRAARPGSNAGRRIDSSARSGFSTSITRSGCSPTLREVGRREQRQREHLVVAGTDEHVGDRPPVALRGREAADLRGVRRDRARDLVEPDAARDLLDEVDLALEVGARTSGRSRRRRLHLDAERRRGTPRSRRSSSVVPSSWFTRSVRTVMRAGSIGFGYTSIAPDGRLPRPRPRANSSIARAAPAPGVVRVDAPLEARARLGAQTEPLRGLRDAADGSKYADSSRISVVASETSAAAPPMIPAMPCGDPFAVADQEVVDASASRSTPSSVVIFSPARASRTTIPRPGETAEVERVQRTAPLEHHVVGDVDDVADRPHARPARAGAASSRATRPS